MSRDTSKDRALLDELAYIVCYGQQGGKMYESSWLYTVSRVEKYIKERSEEIYEELWLKTYEEFNRITFGELNCLRPAPTKIDCIDFSSTCFSTTEKMQMIHRGYAVFNSQENKEKFVDFATSLVQGRGTGLGYDAEKILNLQSKNKPKPAYKYFEWYEQEVYDKLYTYDDWSQILHKIETYASCDTMGSEKVAKRKEGEPDNLQTRMERWEKVNFKKMKDLSPNEWIRVVNNIGCMTESEAEELYYSFQTRL